MANKKSARLEKLTAKDFSGGRATINSGAYPSWRQDVQSDNFVIEHKYTDAKSYILKKAYFSDIIKEAFKLNKLPAMVIEFTDRPELKVAVIRYEELLALDEYLSKENARDK